MEVVQHFRGVGKELAFETLKKRKLQRVLETETVVWPE